MQKGNKTWWGWYRGRTWEKIEVKILLSVLAVLCLFRYYQALMNKHKTKTKTKKAIFIGLDFIIVFSSFLCKRGVKVDVDKI